MFKPLALSIGLRYIRARRRHRFISLIALTPILGIALGVMALITVLSVMNGFDNEIHQRVMSMAREVVVNDFSGNVHHWQDLSKELKKSPEVIAVMPIVNGQGMISGSRTLVHPVVLNGVLPKDVAKVSELPKKMVAGNVDDLKAGKFDIILGSELADTLGVSIGDKVTIIIPKLTVSPAGVVPRFKRFTVSGLFQVGNGFGFDTHWAFINLKDAQKLFQLGNSVSALQLKVSNFYQAPKIAKMIASGLTSQYYVNNWTQEYGALFHAIQLEKTMMFLMLLLIIAVASFNLVSTLAILVNDKQADIAILRTMGASPRFILMIFIFLGCLIGFIGTLLGLGSGLLLATHVTEIVNSLEQVFDVKLLSSSIYFVNYVPSEWLWSDIWHICTASFIMSFIATLSPAIRASKVQAAEALRYE